MEITKKVFGYFDKSVPVHLYEIKNVQGSAVELLELGARIHALRLPDRSGVCDDICQSFDKLEAYCAEGRYHGAVCGPFANRIGGAAALRKGQLYSLPRNEGENCLHSGPGGFHARLWAAQLLPDGLHFSLESEENEGFPGAYRAEVIYRFSDEDVLTVHYRLFAREDCLFSPTNHVFLNLSGGTQDDLGEQTLRVRADFFTPTDKALLTTGEIRPVKDTAWDFNEARVLRHMLESHHAALAYSRGYDQNFVLRKTESGALEEAAVLYDPASGRGLRLFTTQDGLQLYTANFPPPAPGRNGRPYAAQAALCLETQGFPNSPAHTHFPSAWVGAGESKEEMSVFEFYVE